MGFVATGEQTAIINGELASRCVIACAGSGKTATAVRRLIEIRRRLTQSRGQVALLSYSNVAVDTFRREYAALTSDSAHPAGRVLISTADSFISTQVVSPHAGRLMKCDRQPFLVRGTEPFLKGHRVFNGSFSVGIDTLRAVLTTGGLCNYELKGIGPGTPVSSHVAEAAIIKLAKSGAYTHELGRYWAWRTLRESGRLAQILARRYPHILVDEAQDVGSLHGGLLSLLQACGATVTLIGDPNQAIFEFADADGSFLRGFAKTTTPQPLTANRRSVTAIVAVSNALCGTASTAVRADPQRVNGAYMLEYNPAALDEVRESFASILADGGYAASDAAILCRGRSLLEEMTGGEASGNGATQKFVRAAICRDRRREILKAFEFVVDGVVRLLKAPPDTLRRDCLGGSGDPAARAVRRTLWRFLRDSKTGLPSAALPAQTEWHPALKRRLPMLLDELKKCAGLESSATWKNNVTIRDLGEGSLMDSSQAASSQHAPVRTVHEVKGEGISAVLYLARKPDISALLAGPSSEEGRIGYVAVTRARDLLILGVPKGTRPSVLQQLKAVGFREWGAV